MVENSAQATSATSGSARNWVTITPSSVAFDPDHETNHLLLLDNTSVKFDKGPTSDISGASLRYDVRTKGLSYQGGSRWTFGGRKEGDGIEVVRFEAMGTIDRGETPEIFRVGAERDSVFGYLTAEVDAGVGDGISNGTLEAGNASRGREREQVGGQA